MPPKMKHRGGRPKSEYGNLSEEQIRLLHTEAVQAHRGTNCNSNVIGPVAEDGTQAKTETDNAGRAKRGTNCNSNDVVAIDTVGAQAQTETDNNTPSTPEAQVPSTPQEKPKQGRHSLSGSAMTPNTLRNRISSLNTERRKKERLSMIRKNSVMARWRANETSHEVESDVEDSNLSNTNELCNTSKDCIGVTRLYILREKLLTQCLCPLQLTISSALLCAPKFFQLTQLKFPKIEKLGCGGLSKRQLRYRREQLQQKIFHFLTDENSQEFILRHWITRLIETPIGLAIVQSWNLDAKYLPQAITLSLLANEICQTILQRNNISSTNAFKE